MILNPFKDKNILITGGSKGIGLCMAKELAALKANIAIIARDKVALGIAQREIEEAGSGIRCLAYACDVTDPNTLSDYINMVRYEFGRIDGIIANSGYCHPGTFHELSLADMDRQIDVNLKGVVYTLRLGIPHLLENGGGFVAITSSPAGNAGIYGFSIYGATKSALNIMSHTLRAEYATENIRVHLLLPPDTDTPGYAEEVLLYPPETKAILDGGVLMQPERVAKKFVRGMANNKKTISAGLTSRLLLIIMRIAPRIWDLYVRSRIRAARAGVGEPIEAVIETDTPLEPEDETSNADPVVDTSVMENEEFDVDIEEDVVDEDIVHEEITTKTKVTPSPQEPTPEDEPDFTVLDDEVEDSDLPEEEKVKSALYQHDFFEDIDLTEVIVGLEIEELKPFLDRITKYAAGLQHEITNILVGVAEMDTKQDKTWELNITHEQKSIPFRIDVSMNEDDSVSLRFYTTTRLSFMIDQEYSRMFTR